MDSPDAEHVLALTIAIASAFGMKTDGAGRPARVAFMTIKVERR